MHRMIFARGDDRAFALVPYGIVAVVAADSWEFAWSLNSGWIPKLLGLTSDPLSHTFGPYVAITRRGVEEHSVHGAAAPGRAGARPGRAAGGGQGRRRHDLAAVLGITVPLMKPAILVALLFRTLDAFRIFDTIYIFGQGANGTESLSMLNYSTLLDRLNLGLGSAVSVLLFLMVALIAFVFITGFGVGRRVQDGGSGHESARRGSKLVGRRQCIAILSSSSLVPVVWIVMLSLKTPATATDGIFIPHQWTLSNYSDIFSQGIFTDALRNSIGIALISTALAVAPRLDGGLRDRPPRLPRQAAHPRRRAGRRHVPAGSLVGPLYNLWRQIGLYDTWAGLIIPYMTFALPLSIYTLSAFFRQIPWGSRRPRRSTARRPFRPFAR